MSDFSGLATVYDILCSDGRVIKPGAFDAQVGETVPLVWRHGHDDMNNIVGHGILQVSPKPPGMRFDGIFNKTKEGRRAKQLVSDKDVQYLSIWANEILEHAVQDRREVEFGVIREVSLVLAGANPGAYIDDVIRHSDDPFAADIVELDGIIVHNAYKLDFSEC